MAWTLYHSNSVKKIDATIMGQVQKLVYNVAPISNKAFGVATAQTLVDLVNKTSPAANPFNWMKVHCRAKADNSLDAVIVYQLLKCTTDAFGVMQWSVTVGFDPTGFTAQLGKGNPNDNNNEYVVLAKDISSVIKSVIGQFNPKPTSLLSIDPAPAKDSDVESEAGLRSSHIGELFWLSERNREIRKAWPEWSASYRDAPRNFDGNIIPSYDRFGSGFVNVTEFKVPSN